MQIDVTRAELDVIENAMREYNAQWQKKKFKDGGHNYEMAEAVKATYEKVKSIG